MNKEGLFKDSFIKPEKGGLRKGIALPVAILVHIGLVAALVIIPLLSTQNLPAIEILFVTLAPFVDKGSFNI